MNQATEYVLSLDRRSGCPPASCIASPASRRRQYGTCAGRGTTPSLTAIVDENDVTYTGHITLWFGSNWNEKNENNTFTFSLPCRDERPGSETRIP